jgi:hypothetical protein
VSAFGPPGHRLGRFAGAPRVTGALPRAPVPPEEQRRRVVLHVQCECDRHARGVQAADVGAVDRPAEVADELGAAGQCAALDAEPVADEAALALRRRDGQHLLQGRAVAEQSARQQRVQEAREVLDRGDQRSGARCAGERRVEIHVDRVAVERDVAVRMRAPDRAVSRRGQVRAGQAQRADDSSRYLTAPRVAGDPLDDHAEQGVVGVGVGEARSRREDRRLCGREIEELGDPPNLGGISRDLLVDGGAVPVRDPGAMAEQHTNGDVGRVRNAAGDARGEHVGEPGVERQPAALGELQHGDGDERLHDAGRAEAIAGAHRFGRRNAAEAGDAGPAAELRAAHVQDRPRGVHGRIAQAVVQRPLEPTGEIRVEARVGPGRDRRGVSRGARGRA